MVQEIDKALFNPVWQQVRTPAPWDAGDALLLDVPGAGLPVTLSLAA